MKRQRNTTQTKEQTRNTDVQINEDKIHKLLHSTETSRIERSVSTGDIDKFQEAICAFSNLND